MKRQITIDGIPGTWTPDPDDGWEYVGKITEFESGYEYEREEESGSFSWSYNYHRNEPPTTTCNYRRRRIQV